MKRSEMLAWSAVAALLAAALILLYGGVKYEFTAFWAGMMMLLAQALVVGLAAWGLMLARQSAELSSGPPIGGAITPEPVGPTPGSGFRMTMGGDESQPVRQEQQPEAAALDTGFQRLLVGVSGFLLAGLGGLIGYLIYRTMAWARLNPDQPFPIAGPLATTGKDLPPVLLDNLALVIGLASAAIYGTLYWTTRPRRDDDISAEVVHGNFVLGLGGAAALAVATVLGYMPVAYASELASGVIAALMVLQGLELLVNCLRSYSGIEELDLEAVDLQSLPLVPMLGSVWLSGLKLLFTQSVGLSADRRGERGVIARMMPRTLLAIIAIAIGVSCLRVIKPGEVAILERLGAVDEDKDGNVLDSSVLQPGLRLTFPWPIDQLVRIPTQTLQFTDVGAEVHGSKGGDNVEYQFWTIGLGDINSDVEQQSRFVTGDRGGQILETYVGVWWRVRNPAYFYSHLSHSEFYEKGPGETQTVPIYQAIVQQSASFAVTRTFAIHSLDQVMIKDRKEVEAHCKLILQEKLDEARSGIEVADLTIQDLHPPFFQADQPDPSQWDGKKHGPAAAFESVVSALEAKQTTVNLANRDRIESTTLAEGQAANDKSRAEAYFYDHVATAQGDSARVLNMIAGGVEASPNLQDLARRLAVYRELRDAFGPVDKIIVDPQINVQFIQTTDKGVLPMRPPGG